MKKRAYSVALAALVALMVASGASAKRAAGFAGYQKQAQHSYVQQARRSAKAIKWQGVAPDRRTHRRVARGNY